MKLVAAASAWTLTILLASHASAGTQALSPKEHKSLQAFADANKDCGEWSDGCAVCLRHPDGSFACSLPGIACEPAALTCRAEDKDKGAH